MSLSKSFLAFLFLVVVPVISNAAVEVQLTPLAQSKAYLSRVVAGKPCVLGYITSVEFKSVGSTYSKDAVVELRTLGGIGRESNALLARVFFKGNDSAAGMSMANLIYRNSGISGKVEVCANGDIKASAFAR